MSWTDQNGTVYPGTNPQAQQQYATGSSNGGWSTPPSGGIPQGMNPNSFSTTYRPGTGGSTADPGYWPGSAGTPGTTQTSYNGTGGPFTQNNNGSWTSGTGQTVNDLSGYTNMKGQQAQGSDFSGYQNQLNNLLANPSSVAQTPGYQFAMDQGNQAINRSAAAGGALNSGNVLAELSKYGQGMASQGYNQQVNTLSGLMGQAQNFGVQSGYFPGSQMNKTGNVAFGTSTSNW
jgi:hypothetical protein